MILPPGATLATEFLSSARLSGKVSSTLDQSPVGTDARLRRAEGLGTATPSATVG
jgi:hypothetical protein